MIINVLANLFSRPATRPLPTAPEGVPGYRGAVEFNREECNYCGACAVKCPSTAIVVDRSARTMSFDLFRCIQCASCADACRKGCIQLATTAPPALESRPETRLP